LRTNKNKKDHSNAIDLLLISKGSRQYYCLINILKTLAGSFLHKFQEMNAFGDQNLLNKHIQICGKNQLVRVEMPAYAKKMVVFQNPKNDAYTLVGIC